MQLSDIFVTILAIKQAIIYPSATFRYSESIIIITMGGLSLSLNFGLDLAL